MRLVPAALAATLALCAASRAEAFCRTTTCPSKSGTCEIDAKGCNRSGTPLHWDVRPPLTFRFQKDGSSFLLQAEARAAIRTAFYRWTDVMCEGGRTSLRFVEGEEMVEDKSLVGGPNPPPFGIFFRDRGWPHQNADDQLALTTILFRPSGGISYADIEVNTTNYTFSAAEVGDGIDLQIVMTHEVGHYIGLAHSLEPNSIMAAALCEGGDRCSRERIAARRLADDDRAAVCTLYPPRSAEPPAEPPSDGCAQSGPAGGTSALSVVVAAGLVALLRRRRATR